MYLRRSGSVFGEWSSGSVRIIAPRDGRTKLDLGEGVRDFLASLTDWTAAADVTSRLEDKGLRSAEVDRLLQLLLEHQVLECAPEPTTAAAPQPWQQWGSLARLFHAHTRNAPYITDNDRKREYTESLTADGCLPATSKNYPAAPRIELPRDNALPQRAYVDVLLQRRTHRYFDDQPVSLADLAVLLDLTFGPQKHVDGGMWGTLQVRTSPNAGSRHEVEAYVFAFAVSDLPAGVYHYDSDAHALERIADLPSREATVELMYGQPMAETAPVLIATTAVSERIAYKYRDGRAYRLWMYDIGHVGQTFVLTATALGLGAFQTASYADDGIDQLLGIDGEREFTTYLLGCGSVAHLGAPEDFFPITV